MTNQYIRWEVGWNMIGQLLLVNKMRDSFFHQFSNSSGKPYGMVIVKLQTREVWFYIFIRILAQSFGFGQTGADKKNIDNRGRNFLCLIKRKRGSEQILQSNFGWCQSF